MGIIKGLLDCFWMFLAFCGWFCGLICDCLWDVQRIVLGAEIWFMECSRDCFRGVLIKNLDCLRACLGPIFIAF